MENKFVKLQDGNIAFCKNILSDKAELIQFCEYLQNPTDQCWSYWIERSEIVTVLEEPLTWITRNGNILCLQNGQYFFVTSKGEYIRPVNYEQGDDLTLICTHTAILEKEWLKFNPKEMINSQWEYITSFRITTDHSNFESGMCNNGGHYGDYCDYNLFLNRFQNKLAVVPVMSSSSDFSIDESTGDYQQDLSNLSAINADFSYKVWGNIDEADYLENFQGFQVVDRRSLKDMQHEYIASRWEEPEYMDEDGNPRSFMSPALTEEQYDELVALLQKKGYVEKRNRRR